MTLYSTDLTAVYTLVCHLPLLKRVRQVNVIGDFISCSCKFRNRSGKDYPHVYHVVSQSKTQSSSYWWNSFYRFACMSKNDKQFEALDKVMKMLQINNKNGLAVEAMV